MKRMGGRKNKREVSIKNIHILEILSKGNKLIALQVNNKSAPIGNLLVN